MSPKLLTWSRPLFGKPSVALSVSIMVATTSAANDAAAQLQELVQKLSEASQQYGSSPEAQSYIARTNVSQIAKDIVRLMMAPSDMSMHHSVNVRSLLVQVFGEQQTLLITDLNDRCWKLSASEL